MKTIKKAISWLVLSAMLISVICVAPFNVFAATVYYVATAEELDSAVNAINSSDGGEFEIHLTNDISNADKKYSFEKNTTTIYGNNHTITFTNQVQGFTVGIIGDTNYPSVTLNLGSENYSGTLTLKSSGTLKGDEPGALYIWGINSTINMYSGVTVDGFVCNNHYGGGVSIEAGTFNMYDGTIKNCGIIGGSVCYGGGVAVYNGGHFEMYNGLIKNCNVESEGYSYQIPNVAGGGVLVCASSFIMHNGIIEGCSATNTDDGYTDAVGGGVAVINSGNNGYGYLDSHFTMENGEIRNCDADYGGGALAVGMAYIAASGCCSELFAIANNTREKGIFINGGSMLNCSAAYGGAMFYNWISRDGKPANIKNLNIEGNSAYRGGAIDVYNYWTRTVLDNCIIKNNESETNGGAISLIKNSSNGSMTIKDSVIENNTSGDRGAGVYYDADSQLKISGKNIIKDNTFNGKKNNLNILSSSKPVYVIGDLEGSEIGLSDPTLWDDNMDDTAENAVSTEYLTSGYKTNNTVIPAYAFTSDHQSWYVDYSDVNPNEVRLVRYEKDVNYHINNEDMDSIYSNEIFTPYVQGHEVQVGNVIEEFHNIPQLKDPDGYVFKGWYYDRDSDDRPVEFGKTYEDGNNYEKYKDIYAHWEKVNTVNQEEGDGKVLPEDMQGKYSSFGLFGVQIRPEDWIDNNINSSKKQPGGLRFITSISEKLLSDINELQDNKKLNGNTTNYEYGYVAARKDQVDTFAAHYGKNTTNYTLQYKDTDVNGVDTTGEDKDSRTADTDYRYISNIDCTRRSGLVDHKEMNNYRLSTFVVTYDDDESSAHKDDMVCARAYIRYYDANGLLRTFYNDYNGTTTYGGCCTSYTEAEAHNADNTHTYYKEGAD